MTPIDDIDRSILKALQEDASSSVADVAERAGISQTPCWKRIKKLEERGYIKQRVALLDGEKLGLGLTGFIRIRTSEHTQGWLDRFGKGIQAIPEVVECHRMTGDVDYLIKIVVADMADYDRVYKKLISIAEMADVSANFSMEQLKATTQLPL